MSAEFAFLLAAARHPPTVEQRAAIVARASAHLDWERVLTLAREHRLLSLVLSNQSAFWNLVPPDSQKAFVRAQAAISARAALLHRELKRLLGILGDAAVEALAYKGAALAIQAYGAAMVRDYHDLDLIVRTLDLHPARQTLLANGYAPKYPGDDDIDPIIRRSECDQTLVHGATGVSVELHWAITPPFFCLPLPIEPLFDRRVKLDGADLQAFAPGPEDTVLLLAVNGTKDGWSRLEPVCAIAHLVKSTHAFDWAGLFQRASEVNARRILNVALLLAQAAFSTTVPEPWSTRLQHDAVAVRLANRITAEDAQRGPAV